MKLVINRCYGGFGLSRDAQLALVGCPHIELYEPKEYYGGIEGWEKKFADDRARGDRLFGITLHNGKVVSDEHRRDAARTCPRLIEVVEKMGEKAAGPHAELEIVEIPNGVDYVIDEYDGIEHIAEAHRTWP